MAELNVDVPRWQCFVRREYLYNLAQGWGEVEPVVVFGLSSRPGYAVGFHVMTQTGAVIWRLPVSALVHEPDAPVMPLDYLELWDAFSTQVSVHEFDWLAGLRVSVMLRDHKPYPGRYLFTIDWTGSPEADGAGDIGHKCGHVIELDNGCYAIQPNNRIAWYEPSFVTRPFADTGECPDFRTMTREFSCERERVWATEDSDQFFYKSTEGQ